MPTFDEHNQPSIARSPRKIRRWQRYLANERAEAAVYRELAKRKSGEEKDILLAIAAAESRHEKYWHDLLGNDIGMPRLPGLKTRLTGFLAKRFGSVFTLALMQSAETRTPYEKDEDATEQMAADELIHAEVVRGLAARSREKMSGGFRAAVFGFNDGLVSNLALVLGVAGAAASNTVLLLTGLSGMLAGALSMAAGEYVSVSSQKDLLAASTPDPHAASVLPVLDINANELALVYRARGIKQAAAETKAQAVLARLHHSDSQAIHTQDEQVSTSDVVGSPYSAALSSFAFFAAGALIPVVPFFFGISTLAAAIASCVLVGVALVCTGGIVGVLSGVSPLKKGTIQLVIGLGASAVTFGLGSALGVGLG